MKRRVLDRGLAALGAGRRSMRRARERIAPRMARHILLSCALTTSGALLCAATTGQEADKPNILVIMGDDVGSVNIGAYHQSIIAGKTPNLDQLASDQLPVTDY